MNVDGRNVRAFPVLVLAAALGIAFAIGVNSVWNLEGRWFVVTVVGIALVSIAMIFARRYSDFLFVVLLFCTPLAGFAKWPFLDAVSERVKGAAPVSGTLGIGIIDFILAGLYFAWAFRIFVQRAEPFPRLGKTDFWVGLMLLACICSLWGTESPMLGLFALENLWKHVLLYFYVSRHFKRKHLPWLAAAFAFALAIEAGIAIVQNRMGLLVGLMLDKGAGGELLDFQEKVPGIEDVNRGTGTTYDSHALGAYIAMLLPYALVWLYARRLPGALRLLSGALLLLGLAGLIVTYSRSGWLSGGIALTVAALGLLLWREQYVLPSALGATVAGLLTAPWVFNKLFERFYNAPRELVSARFDQYAAAWNIWRDHLLFGAGAGSYMEQLTGKNLDWAFDSPVHNVPLYVGAELGLFGLIAYYGTIAVVLAAYWRLIRQRQEPLCRIALAAFAGMVAYVFDGMSDPLFRESVVYMMFWVTVALSVALTREARAALPLRTVAEP